MRIRSRGGVKSRRGFAPSAGTVYVLPPLSNDPGEILTAFQRYADLIAATLTPAATAAFEPSAEDATRVQVERGAAFARAAIDPLTDDGGVVDRLIDPTMLDRIDLLT